MNNNKLQNNFTFEIHPEEADVRLDVFASKIMTDFSRSRIQQLIKDENSVLVNDKTSKNSYKLKIGDKVVINVPEAKLLELEPENIPLEIPFEDENMLVVNKPAGMLTHPTSIQKTGTLVNALLYYCEDKLSGINGVMRPGILHRLDKDTSGLLMIAKNDYAHNFLSEQVRVKSAIRQYLTVVNGYIKEDTGTIIGDIGRHPTKRSKMALVENGKHAVTHWKVLDRFTYKDKKFTFLEVTLETGRTHQIRVHFSHNNHPIVGDGVYGGESLKVNTIGQVLQAYKLTFVEPTHKKVVKIELEKDKDLNKLLDMLKSK